MSYDISKERFTMRARADQGSLEDGEREAFLRRLDDAAETVNVTDFEAGILKSFLDGNGKWFWTAPRRHVVDQMRQNYQQRLPLKAEKLKSETLKRLPDSVPGQCSYLIRGGAGQERCGQPATQKNSHGAEFCRNHFQQITEYSQRLRQMKARRVR